jgi:hypothetical protein
MKSQFQRNRWQKICWAAWLGPIRRFVLPLLLGTCISSFGCVRAPDQHPQHTDLFERNYFVPTLVPVEQGSETQDRDGIIVQMQPKLYSVVTQTDRSCRELPAIVIVNRRRTYEVVETSGHAIAEPDLLFAIKVTNRMTHVLKLSGTIFRLTVNGREVDMVSDSYRMFAGGVLIPGEQREFTIRVAPWRSLPRQATIRFEIIEIPTKTDEAGKPTKTDHVGWTFAYAAERRHDSVQISRTTATMTHAEAAALCGRWHTTAASHLNSAPEQERRLQPFG